MLEELGYTESVIIDLQETQHVYQMLQVDSNNIKMVFSSYNEDRPRPLEIVEYVFPLAHLTEIARVVNEALTNFS